ncbi:DUF692 domain-containing protein [Myxococcus hansupus]|uniref:DUF692 domain-containing protein n=1 Tax=Pseudomyxococcus hansupus TaxID=1297742 RepID=UPI000272F492|nr:DUF692 domain-containing protein [Myxococcus hansupus]
MTALGLRGVGIGWRRELAHFIDRWQGLGFVEVLAEHLSPTGPLPEPLVRLRERGVPVVLHAVSLGLGSAEPPEPRRLDGLARLSERLGAVCVSEHLAFVRAGGLESGHLLPVQRSEEALEVLTENIRLAEAALPVPLALENVASLFEWPDAAFHEADLLRGVLAHTQASLLLDVANLHAQVLNHGTDADAVLAAVPRERLAYVHVAGGIQRGGLYHDTHAHPLPEGPLALLERLAARLGPVPVMLERDDRFPPEAELAAELTWMEQALERGIARHAEAKHARAHPHTEPSTTPGGARNPAPPATRDGAHPHAEPTTKLGGARSTEPHATRDGAHPHTEPTTKLSGATLGREFIPEDRERHS